MYCDIQYTVEENETPGLRSKDLRLYSTHLHKRTKNATSALETWTLDIYLRWGGGVGEVSILDILTPDWFCGGRSWTCLRTWSTTTWCWSWHAASLFSTWWRKTATWRNLWPAPSSHRNENETQIGLYRGTSSSYYFFTLTASGMWCCGLPASPVCRPQWYQGTARDWPF